MKQDDLVNILTSKARPEILVIGDIILDKFIWGSVDRISPEAPVQIVNISKENIALGGAANVAHNLVAIGCRTTLAGVIGRDENGKLLRGELRKVGVKDAMLMDNLRPTTTKTRILAGSQQVVRIDQEKCTPVVEATESKLIDYITKNVGRFKVIVISDYNKGVLTDRVVRETLRLCRESGVLSIVDPKRKDLTVYSGASLIKPNAREAELASGRTFSGFDEIRDTALWIQKKCQIDHVLITLGKDGMFLQEKKKSESIKSTAREVYDVTGAGDTVIAYLARYVALGRTISEAAHIANIAAGIAVSHMGTVTVTADEVLRELHEDAGNRKITTATELQRLLPSLRDGKRVVFTNGCFDILHVGHITLLGKAKALGELLIVGVNSDSSVRRLKGLSRPIVPEKERAHILAALEAVDYVVMFDEDTPMKLIRALQPDLLVKGSDYTPDKVVGADFVESYGGKVALVDLVAGFSTSNIIENIRRSSTQERSEAPVEKKK